ncbi:MAG: chromate transporter [Nitrospirae bacterium GWC2_57_13]|jgi:chromate transporter|nr:MAG: chromate transporter [Nitrospirae bacterium GWC1_57_7]OGW30115.1 MAG: chromate transporter [Nitrospirae bacterium GWC2_57_13]OGW43240.1 MAG: chromate transporter [Nitrospirae bacterium GWD2_57_8]HAR46606.1 chromate transporter [Nitrospiraceae bacterium]
MAYMEPTSQRPTFTEAMRYWLKLGFISFGGPTGQIAIMHRDIVDRKKWVDEDHFLHALNFCMLLPGPEAQQLATYNGWLLHGTRGGLVAGVLFVLPAVFILWGLAWLYAAYGTTPSVAAFFYGLKPAVAAIVAEAVIRIGRKSLKTRFLLALAAASFIGIYFLHVPFPAIVFSAGLIGFLAGAYAPSLINTVNQNNHSQPAASKNSAEAVPTGWLRTLKILGLGLTIWFLPIIALGIGRGWDDIFVKIGVLFTKAAVVTFGGAYAVLGYIGQQAVVQHGWITPEQMIDGLGLAETTPGPLIMVNQFVAYLAAYQHTPGFSPALAGAIGGLLATWVTFVPSFIWIFLGAPYVERIKGNRKLTLALAAITAAVVGVVLNLAVIFTRHTLVPNSGGFDWFALVVGGTAFVGLTRLKWGMVPVIIGSALVGFIWRMYL